MHATAVRPDIAAVLATPLRVQPATNDATRFGAPMGLLQSYAPRVERREFGAILDRELRRAGRRSRRHDVALDRPRGHDAGLLRELARRPVVAGAAL